MEMAFLLPSVAISGAVSYGLYRYLLAKQGLHETPLSPETSNEVAATANSGGRGDISPDEHASGTGGTHRYEVFGRDITELVEAAFSSPMNIEARKVYERHLERYGRSFRDGKKVIPFECLIALTHNLQPIVNERGEVLVACFKDDKIKSAPVIDEDIPAKTEFVAKKESITKAEALETPSSGPSNGDFVAMALGEEAKGAANAAKRRKNSREEDVGNPADHTDATGTERAIKREESKKEKPARKAKKAKNVKKEGGAAPGEAQKTTAKEESRPPKRDHSETSAGNAGNAALLEELDVFDVFSEEASGDVEAVAPVDDLGFVTDDKESAGDGDEPTVANEKPPAPPPPAEEATVVVAESESLDMPAHIELDVCEAGQKLVQAIVDAVGSSEEARRAVAHNLAFHRHVILLNRSHVLIEQQYLAQAVVETFRTCFERDAAAIRSFKKNFKAINEIALALTEDKMMRDEYWPSMKAYCVEIDAVNYRGYFLRVGDAFVSKYLGDAVLRKMVLSPQIAAGAGEPDCPKSTPMLYKEIP